MRVRGLRDLTHEPSMDSTRHETCWSLIRSAAAGGADEREEFARRYLPAIRAYLAARWRRGALAHEVEDGVQEVFMACLRPGGVLERSGEVRQGFRAFLFGVTKKIALQMERAAARALDRGGAEADVNHSSNDPGFSTIYDRAYAQAMMREAAQIMSRRATLQDDSAVRRVELLRLRFEEGLAVREIAERWGRDVPDLHLEYAMAGREFRGALREVVGLSERCAPDYLDSECDRLLAMLS